MSSTGNSGFSSKIGYVLAAAGSAVGLGNIWRFPYLTAKYGGGIFLLTYLVLVLTFGYALLVSENNIGRLTGKGPTGPSPARPATCPAAPGRQAKGSTRGERRHHSLLPDRGARPQ